MGLGAGDDIAADAHTCLYTAGLAVVRVAPVDPAPGWAVGVKHNVSGFVLKKTRLGDVHGADLLF